LPGIVNVVGDVRSGTLIVTYDPSQVSPEQITAQIEKYYTVKGTFSP
jgi:hypothetical protein